jgi:hypothetical protein
MKTAALSPCTRKEEVDMGVTEVPDFILNIFVHVSKMNCHVVFNLQANEYRHKYPKYLLFAKMIAQLLGCI